MRRIVFTSLLICAAASCSSSGFSRGMLLADRNVITTEEIDASRGSDRSAYDLIARLKPHFLRSRGVASLRTGPTTAVVYLDGVLYGSLESLKTIGVESVRLIEFINAADATTRYGTNHVGGAILVQTR